MAHHPKCKGLITPTMGNGAGEKGVCTMGTPIWENNLALKGDAEAMWTGNYTSRCTMQKALEHTPQTMHKDIQQQCESQPEKKKKKKQWQ